MLVVATKYFRGSSFMWMFCEAFYLHRLLAAAFSPDGSLLIFYLIGWALPVLPTALYAGLRATAADADCWMQRSAYEFVLIVPNILSLLANVGFLVYILRVLMTLNKPSEQEPAHYRI
ncbi:Diuretic hormone receptor [Gryllus bimaculatus]|nr:Diuretic hormone receptor [Gryllus bimaculatus]